jgi:LEA14-like dessication related protein
MIRPARLAPLLALLALGGCSLLQSLAGSAFEKPKLTFEAWSAEGLDFDGVTVALRYRVENPNSFGLDLRRLGYKLELEGNQIVEGQLPAGLQIPARQATALSIPVRVRWRDVPGVVGLFTSRRDIGYRVSGSAGVGSALGVIDLPFQHEARLALPRLPSIRIEGLRVKDSSLSSLALDVRVRIENGNAFPLPVGALTYGLRLGEQDLVSGGSHPLAAVPPGGHATVSLPVRVNLSGAVGTVQQLLRGAEVRLQGLAGFGDVQVPVDAPAHVTP